MLGFIKFVVLTNIKASLSKSQLFKQVSRERIRLFLELDKGVGIVSVAAVILKYLEVLPTIEGELLALVAVALFCAVTSWFVVKFFGNVFIGLNIAKFITLCGSYYLLWSFFEILVPEYKLIFVTLTIIFSGFVVFSVFFYILALFRIPAYIDGSVLIMLSVLFVYFALYPVGLSTAIMRKALVLF
jgi:hypothetical protein